MYKEYFESTKITEILSRSKWSEPFDEEDATFLSIYFSLACYFIVYILVNAEPILPSLA